jgi:hypothetical protein
LTRRNEQLRRVFSSAAKHRAPMQKASEYLRNAQECRRLSGAVLDPQQKAMLQKMADTWESLAADHERRVAQKERIAELERPALRRRMG